MLDLSNWELLGLAVDVFVVYLLNRFYKSQIKDANLVMVSLSFQTVGCCSYVSDTVLIIRWLIIKSVYVQYNTTKETFFCT